MKEEALKSHSDAVAAADVALYDAAFADGQAGSQPSGITQEQLDAAVTQAKADGVAEGEKSGFEKGVASVPVPVEGGTFDQAAMDQYAASKVEQAIAALPADVTPYSQEDMDKVTAELSTAKSELEKVTSDDASDKAAIAAGQSKIDAVLAILKPA